jgi:hypothetical protein
MDNYGGKTLNFGGPADSALQLSDLQITEDNFDPANPTKRPPGWQALRVQRVLTKEAVAHIDPSTIGKMRPLREAHEEELMIKEIQNYVPFGASSGRIFTIGIPTNTVLCPADLVINSSTFDPAYYLKRPNGWGELRAKRVFAKERCAGVDMTTFTLERMRPVRDAEVFVMLNCHSFRNK